MKNVTIVILLLVVVVGGLWFQKQRQATHAEARLVALQKEAAELQAGIAQREEGDASLREKLEKSVVESAVNAGQAAPLSQALTNRLQSAAPPAASTKPPNPLAEMFKNPEMRERMKQQQQTAMASLIEKNYADFRKAQPLSPEQAGVLKDLITRKMMVGADLGLELMSGELTTEQRADLMKRIKTETDAITGESKAFLGADNYAAFETYEKSLPDQMAVSGF